MSCLWLLSQHERRAAKARDWLQQWLDGQQNCLPSGLPQNKFTSPALCHPFSIIPQSHLRIRLRNGPVTLTWDTAQASSGFSRRRSENSIKTLQAAATDWSWFRGTEKVTSCIQPQTSITHLTLTINIANETRSDASDVYSTSPTFPIFPW